MGASIPDHIYRKLEALRDEGRNCVGPTRSRYGCGQRATVKVFQRAWAYRVGEGVEQALMLTMCELHADEFPVNYHGMNFIVVEHKEY